MLASTAAAACAYDSMQSGLGAVGKRPVRRPRPMDERSSPRSADAEVVERLGLLFLDVDAVHVGLRRSRLAELDERLDGVLVALEDRLDRALVGVADPAPDA